MNYFCFHGKKSVSIFYTNEFPNSENVSLYNQSLSEKSLIKGNCIAQYSKYSALWKRLISSHQDSNSNMYITYIWSICESNINVKNWMAK